METLTLIGQAVWWVLTAWGYVLAVIFGVVSLLVAGIAIDDREWGMAAVLLVISLVILRAGGVI